MSDKYQDELGAISRRAMLGLLGGAVVVAGGAVAVWRTTEDSNDEPLASGTEKGPSGDDTIARIGRSYLAMVPAENDAAKLRKQLPDMLDAEESQLARLKAASAADFKAGHVVAIDGWVLSLTEARAAALLTLS